MKKLYTEKDMENARKEARHGLLYELGRTGDLKAQDFAVKESRGMWYWILLAIVAMLVTAVNQCTL